MKTLADAFEAGEAVETRAVTRAGITRHRCDACARTRPAFALRDVRESPAFGAARFVCDECEGQVRRALAPLFAALMSAGSAP